MYSTNWNFGWLTFMVIKVLPKKTNILYYLAYKYKTLSARTQFPFFFYWFFNSSIRFSFKNEFLNRNGSKKV